MQYNLLFRVIPLFVVVWVINLAGFSLADGIEKGYTRGFVKEGQKLPVELDVMLKCEYLDGEISEEAVRETIYSYENFWAKFDEWQFVGMENDRMVFQKKVDDISPLLKTNGYFGVTEDGILTIFNGRPYKSNIIHSFFQIDVGKLESRKREELLKGIPIKTKDRYVKVLETFKSYTLEEMEAR
ncbi:BofC C-terminal domain-containing protein [Bacillus benzoevorans]|uniref:Forespore regulator of the sigma-K checkpoint n=1 Tax=Bacillus benzoevorans TaxID=1456 RepID=A0A7X0HS70_9BACI|nr:BofC C-terminal domain-containing protein [Bacillus benzoevorans]MBB6445897.1 forespore regulator of the sigma-K checkpoint [Bacillus benzoevorans]